MNDTASASAAAPETLLASPDQVSQDVITREIQDLHAAYARRETEGEGEWLPATMYDFPPYRSSVLRHPTKNPKLVDPETIELWSPAFGQRDVAAIESDLTVQHAGAPLGERMTVRGRLLDSWGRPVPNQLIEIWQANASGRYIHQRDQHPAPLDPNFTGAGRTVTNDAGEYLFTTIKPGPYPWKNHVNAWRPAHIHFSVFGSAFTQRIVTQMYFPGDPLFPLDPIYNTIPRQSDRDALIGVYDHDLTSPEWSTGYRFDIVVDGPDATWFEQDGGPLMATPPASLGPRTLRATAGQTVGPFFAYGVEFPKMHQIVHPYAPGAVVLEGTVYDGAHAPIPDALLEIFGADTDGSVPRERGALRRDDRTFTGFGRAATTDEGHFEFVTRNPGPARTGAAPFFAVIVFARGLPSKLHTRIYLPDDEAALAADPLLSTLTAAERATLVATRAPDGGLRHDIHLQGEKETVFLAF